jgi:hypothetical protein
MTLSIIERLSWAGTTPGQAIGSDRKSGRGQRPVERMWNPDPLAADSKGSQAFSASEDRVPFEGSGSGCNKLSASGSER